MKLFISFFYALLFCSCVSSVGSLQRVTASEIGDTSTDEVDVYNVNRGATSISWEAKTPSGCYKCDADDMLKRVHCIKVKCSKIINKEEVEEEVEEEVDNKISKDNDVGQFYIVKMKTANIREEPSITAKIVTKVIQGTKIRIIGMEGEWYEVLIDDNSRLLKGYIHKSIVDNK